MSPLIMNHKQTQEPNTRQHPFSRQFHVSMQILFPPSHARLHIIDLPIQHGGFWIQKRQSSQGERGTQTMARSNEQHIWLPNCCRCVRAKLLRK